MNRIVQSRVLSQSFRLGSKTTWLPPFNQGHMGLPHHVFGGANRPHGPTSETYNCATQSTCGNFVAGGNKMNNYHSQEFWARRRFSVNGAAFFMAAFVFLGWFWRGPLGMH